MQVSKNGPNILIQLNQEESEAVDYFIELRGPKVLDEYFSHFLQTRIETRKEERKRILLEAYNSASQSERNAFLKGRKL